MQTTPSPQQRGSPAGRPADGSPILILPPRTSPARSSGSVAPVMDFSSTARHSDVLSGLKFTPAPVSKVVAPTKGKGGRDSPDDDREEGGGGQEAFKVS